MLVQGTSCGLSALLFMKGSRAKEQEEMSVTKAQEGKTKDQVNREGTSSSI